MMKRNMALVISMFAVGIATGVGCSAPDPGTLTYGSPGSGQTGGNTNTGKDSGTSTPPPNNNPPPVADAGTGGTGNGGVDAAPPPASGGGDFLGETTPYASNLPGTSAKDLHKQLSQPQQTPGQPCMSCHGKSGPGLEFLAAGFVGAGTGTADVEVRVWSAASKAGASAHTDEDGYFWIKPAAGAVTAPFQVGLRDATRKKLMPVDAPAGGCANCHNAGVTL